MLVRGASAGTGLAAGVAVVTGAGCGAAAVGEGVAWISGGSVTLTGLPQADISTTAADRAHHALWLGARRSFDLLLMFLVLDINARRPNA